MSKVSKTDRELSLTATEFEWEAADFTSVHRFVIPPILKHLKARQARRVLDLGSGNGVLTHALHEAGFEVVGLEPSQSGLEVARANFPAVTYEQHDVNQPLPETYRHRFDAVISIEVIEHLLLPRNLLRNAVDAVKPDGGLVLISTPFHGYLKNLALALTNKFDSHWHPLRDYGHVKFFSKRTLLDVVREFGLRDVTFETVGRVPAFARSMIVTGVTGA